MNCSEFQKRCEQVLDAPGQTFRLRADLQQHLLVCPRQDCRVLWQQTELLTTAVRQWQNRGVEVDLTERVLSRLQQQTPQQQHRPRQIAATLRSRYALVQDLPPAAPPAPAGRSWVPVLTGAAALLLVLSVLTLSGPTGQDVASMRPIPKPMHPQNVLPDVQSPPRPLPDAPAAHPPGRRLAGTYAAMPLSATQFLTDAVVLVVPADLSDADEEPSPADIWAERLEQRWAPIGRELNRSLEVLIDAVPRSESAT